MPAETRGLSRREALAADAAVASVTAIWGSTFVVNRLVLDTTPPLLFLLLRFGLAAAVLLVLAHGRRKSPGLFKDSAVIGALLAGGIGTQLVGQLFTTASKAAFVTGLSVPLTPVIGFITTRKTPTRENLTGLIVAAAGFAVLSWPAETSGLNVGDMLVLVTAVLYAYLIVYLGETAGRHDVRWFSAGQMLFATLGVGLLRLAATPFLNRPEAFFAAEGRALPLDGRLLLAVLWMGLMASVLTTLVQTWAQARMSATHAAVLFALEPVFTAVFAAIILGERMSSRDIAGAALVLLGILVSELPARR